jgi:hypothetical protein
MALETRWQNIKCVNIVDELGVFLHLGKALLAGHSPGYQEAENSNIAKVLIRRSF